MEQKKLLLLTLCLTVCMPILSNPVTEEQAREKASQFLSSNTFGKPHKAKALARDLRVANVGDNESYYVFNIGEDEGFVIVNGEDDMEEIIGYSEDGVFDAEQMPENMKFWMQSYKEQIEWVRANKGSITRKGAKVNSHEYENFLLDEDESGIARWGQDEPYNNKCPSIVYKNIKLPTPTGCAITAMAQLLYWHKQPATIASTIPANKKFDLDAVPAGTVIEWDNMKRKTKDYSKDGPDCDAVASLMLFCGQALNAVYGNIIHEDEEKGILYAETSAYIQFQPYALCKYFGFKDKIKYIERNNYDNDEWEWLIYSELSKNRPVYYGGSSPVGGHAFLLEGYEDGRFYVNWGWDGYHNGFFKLDLLNGYDYDYVGFDYNQCALINVEPGGDATQYSARLTTRTLSVDKQTVSRSSSSSNFPAFTVTTKVASRNPITLKFREGFGLFKDGNLVGSTWTNDKKKELDSFDAITYSMDIKLDGSLEDGVYHLCPTSCESSFDNMMENYDSQKYYIKVTKQGNDLMLETFDPSKANLKLSQFEPRPGSVYKVNRWLEFDITVSNNSVQAYNGDFKLCRVFINDKGEEEDKVVAITHLDLGANGIAAFSMRFLPTLEGKHVIRVLDKNDKELGRGTATIMHGENMDVSDWTIVNGDFMEHVLLGTTLNGSVKIKNKDSLPFDGNVWFELIDTDSPIPLLGGTSISKELQLAPDEQKEVNFSFDGLTEGHNYYISIRYDDSAEACKSETFVCKHLDISALTTGDMFTAETIEGVTVNYIITDVSRRTVSVMGIDGNPAVDENTSGSVTLPSVVNDFLVTAIGEGAFAYLEQITSVYIPPTVKYIGPSAFFYCSELTEVDGMKGVQVIDEIAFRLCGKVKRFNLPNTLTTINTQAFGSCTSLESIVIPASVRWLEPDRGSSYKLFEGCSNLKTIKVAKGNLYFDSRENCNAIIETATNTLYAGCRSTKIVDGIESIGDFAFGFIDNIGIIEIPASVKSIGKYAFAQCENLTGVKLWSKEPIDIGEDVFTDYNLKTLYVPSYSKQKYAGANVWGDFGQIKEFPVFDQEPIEGLQLVIYFSDNRSLSYSLNDRPRFQIVDNEVIFTTAKTELTFKGSDIESFIIEYRDETFNPDAIRFGQEEIASSRFVEGQLHISGTQPGAPVHIYGTDGAMVYAGVTNEKGSLTIDISDQKSGIYIVNMGEISIKLMKK